LQAGAWLRKTAPNGGSADCARATGKRRTAMTMAGEDDQMDSHRKTYQAFMRLLTWSTAGVIVVLILMALFLL
jgi:hypothetical protein